MAYSALPEPMLAKSGKLPAHGGFAYEVKWDGFRAVVSTEGSLRVRSRRGWNMTEHVQFLVHLPVRAVLDGELVAFDHEGKPDFPLVCEAVLHRHASIPLTFVAFDLLSVEGRSVTREPYVERRRILEEMGSTGQGGEPRKRSTTARRCGRPCASTNSRASWKRRSSRYASGERGWVKTKNRDYWRYELERESAIRHRARRPSPSPSMRRRKRFLGAGASAEREFNRRRRQNIRDQWRVWLTVSLGTIGFAVWSLLVEVL
jgi:ATP-dependent DNA ligase